jgi:integral membrane protein (TIGR01906 family)
MVVLLVPGHARGRVPRALVGGGLLTLGLLGAVGAYMLLGWDQFFTTFHRLFFEGDTWLFLYSDTLIRLFPMRFWIDVAVMIVGLLVLKAVVVGIVGWVWKRRVDSVVKERRD